MSEEESTAPDFAMLRAVEILAGIYEREQQRFELPPPMDRPVLLFNEAIGLDVATTTRSAVQRALGIAFAYPAAGWHTYCVRGANHSREFLSLFYIDDHLASAELYIPKSERAPRLEPRDIGRFRFVPGEIAIGMPTSSLPATFGRVSALAEELGTYSESFQARFPGGAAYAMGNDGTIERLAIYVMPGESTAK